jgi:putative MATE family efflux protein
MGAFSKAAKSRSELLLNRYLTGNSMDYKQIFGLIIPIFVDTAFIVLISTLNTAMISSSGPAAVSAVSMVDSLNMFLVNMFIALATGGTVIVAQYKGSGNREMISRAASQAVMMATLVSLFISLIIIVFHQGALQLLFGRAEADVFHNARIYLIGCSLTFPFFAIYQAVVGVLRGVAETKTVLILSVIMNLAYFLMNIVFITYLDMGVTGLVISLFLARLLGASLGLGYIVRYSQTLRFKIKEALSFDIAVVKKIMYIGLPFAVEQMFFNGGKLLTQTYIVQLGTMALTVNAIGSSLSNVSQIGATTLSVGIVTVVGMSLGRKDIDDAKKFTKSFLGLCAIWFILAAAVILPLFPYLIKLFSPPEEIISHIFWLMVLILIGQPLFWTLSFILPSALRAGGDSKFTSITALLTMWLIRVILGYILGITLGFGIMGVWVAMVIEWGVRGTIFLWRFKGDKWYRHKLI